MFRFRGFDPRAPVRVYHRNLPHWRQEGCTYFVTFRLADSIPRAVVLRQQEARRVWLDAHGIGPTTSAVEATRKYAAIAVRERRAFERSQAHELHVELDRCHGSCLFRGAENRALVHGALLHFHGVRHACGDFAIMPNHVHWLVQPLAGFALENILRAVKQFTSGRVIGAVRGSVWQSDSYDHIVRDSRELNSCRRYIAENPAKAGVPGSEGIVYRADWLDEALP